MPETMTERLAAVIGLVAAAVLLFIAFSANAHEDVVPVAASSAGETAGGATIPPDLERLASPVGTRTKPAPKRPASTPLLVLTAARGDCWLSARSGSAEGRVLYEGTLLSGRSLRLDGAQVWVRFGAAANVDVTLNGRETAPLPAGTGDVVVTAKGIRPAA
jgi:hypothetical protein